ncbi:MAG: 2,3-bisphosphoglycerate-independent phosphoglycerate mutase, partial [Planctomycetes bacterium]|nr:2,3-bisphosphoglycerate-independent phosphoglycerate mutase [Planctomycetota bacterium]
VGLPDGQMGNSEVGHLNMGAGRVVYQDLARINQAISDGSFARNPALVQAMQRAEERDRAVHLVGLCSDGGVHSHLEHLHALLRMAKEVGVERVYVHAITDGRDTDREAGKGYLEQILAWTREVGLGEVATVSGRYYAMDRDTRWERVQRAYDVIVHGKGPQAPSALAAIEASYAAGKTDEFIEPVVIVPPGGEPAGIRRGDQVITFNFRADRMRQFVRALTEPRFDGFPRQDLHVVEVVTLTEYQAGLPVMAVAYEPQVIKNHLSALVGGWGSTQFKCAETEKYAHVTFFWNGGVEAACPGEARHLVPSPKVATYDLQPEMCADAVTQATLRRLAEHDDALIVVNFANTDMVGHTGNLEAAIQAVQTVDRCVGELVDGILGKGGAAIVTADHGNCEMMLDPTTGRVHTAHTTCPVHAILVDPTLRGTQPRPGGTLADLAPSALDLMRMPQPPEMTGRSLVVRG